MNHSSTEPINSGESLGLILSLILIGSDEACFLSHVMIVSFKEYQKKKENRCNRDKVRYFRIQLETVSLDNRNPLIQHLYCYFMYRYRPATGSLTENIFHLCLLCFLHLGELQLLFY